MPPLASYVRTPYATPGLLSPMVKTSEGTIYPNFQSRVPLPYGLPSPRTPLASYFPWPNMCGRPMLPLARYLNTEALVSYIL